MNKNDKFRNADFEVNAHAISDDELDAVAGGALRPYKICPYCGSAVDSHEYVYNSHIANCLFYLSVGEPSAPQEGS